MFQKDFDPLQILHDLQGQVTQCSKNITQLALALNQQREMQEKIIAQLNEQTHAINALDTNQQDHDGRIRLMEIARQYESKSNDTV